MSRLTEDGLPAFVGPKMKQRVVRCPHCSIELNLPESALGRRLKCPKCESKFTVPMPQDQVSAEEGSSLYLPTHGPGSSGSVELPSFGGGGSSGDVELSSSLAPLRETFDLPLLSEVDPPSRSHVVKSPATGGESADVLGLFQDEPKSNRKPKGAAARAQARRCSSCSTIVPAGMSLCSKCGLDLDTGKRHSPAEIFEDAMPIVHRNPTPPIGVLLVGSLCSFGFLLLAFISLIQWSRGVDGAPFLLIVWLFGLYSGIQFLRRKSIKPILVALSLAVGVAAVYLIFLPIYVANFGSGSVIGSPNSSETFEEVYMEGPRIKPLSEQIDLNRITWGIGSLLSYAAVAVYLNSPGLRRHFIKHQ